MWYSGIKSRYSQWICFSVALFWLLAAWRQPRYCKPITSFVLTKFLRKKRKILALHNGIKLPSLLTSWKSSFHLPRCSLHYSEYSLTYQIQLPVFLQAKFTLSCWLRTGQDMAVTAGCKDSSLKVPPFVLLHRRGFVRKTATFFFWCQTSKFPAVSQRDGYLTMKKSTIL